MKTEFKDTPRTYSFKDVVIKDMGSIVAEAGERLGFVTPAGRRLDVTAHEWGFTVAEDVAGTLRKEGFKSCLVFNRERRLFIHAVEEDRMQELLDYLADDGRILCWVHEWLSEQK